MSLATRCSTCGTTFRVVQDQLKVSEGWVRCGKCQTVFNAVEGLFDLDRDAPDPPRPAESPAAVPPPEAVAVAPFPDPPPAVRPPPVAPVAPAAPAAMLPAPPVESPAIVFRESVAAAPPAPAAPAVDDDPESDPPMLHPRPGPKPASAVGARDRLEFSDARFDSDLFEEEPPLDAPGAGPATGSGALPLESEMAPDFLRRPERRQGWRPQPSRGVLGGLAGLAALALAAQVALHHRAALASAWPWTREPLEGACAVAGCAVEPPRRIDALSVESTALARAVAQDGFVLTVALRNRTAVALVTPSVDLTLTDGTGRLVARRALAPGELNAAASVAPGADVVLQTALDVRGVRVAGYTVEIFYP